jgi:hypothetical protein
MNPTSALLQILGPKTNHGNNYYITVSVTGTLCDTLPDVAVTVIEYVPAGVPEGFACGLEEASPLQAASPAATSKSSAKRNCGASRRRRSLPDRNNDTLRTHTTKKQRPGNAG